MDKNKSLSKTLFLAFLVSSLILANCSAGSSGNTASGGVGVVSSVTVTNKIETSGNLSADKLATLQWGTSGVIEKVNIQVGDKVKINDILAALRSDSVSSDIATGQSDLATAQRDLQDILDSTTSQAQAQLNVLTARKNVETAQNNLDALDYHRASDTYIKNLEAQIQVAKRTLTLAIRRYNEVKNHFDGDAQKSQAILDMTNAQMSLNSLQATLNYVTASATQADYDTAKANLAVARAALEDAQRNRDNVKNGADPLKLAAAQAKVTAAQATVNTMYIIAPFDGEVISVQAGVGNSVNSADSAVELVDRNTLKVETLVDETSISSVSVGNPAEISMDSLPGVILTGKVGRIKRIGTVANGLVKYTVVVLVDPTDKPVLFGATVYVAITTGEPHSMLAVPIGAVLSDSKGEYVLLISADGNSSQRVNIQSGDLSGNLVTITTTGNLKEGDQVEIGTGSTTNNNSGGNNNSPGGPGGPFGGD
jgi:RND family efflux transporter MFP subunit